LGLGESQTNLLQGTLDLLILKAIGDGEFHGLGISSAWSRLRTARFASANISAHSRTSSSRSASALPLCARLSSAARRRDHLVIARPLSGLQCIRYCARNRRPFLGLDPQLALARFRSPVILRAPVILRITLKRS
jgi:hypothetical protein